MLLNFIRKIRLKFFKDLKKDDVLYGDSMDFRMDSSLNQAIHGLNSPKEGPKIKFWQGVNTYRITIKRAFMPYYVFDGEVLTKSIDDNGQFVWKKRRLENRIMKHIIHVMILDGKLKKE